MCVCVCVCVCVCLIHGILSATLGFMEFFAKNSMKPWVADNIP